MNKGKMLEWIGTHSVGVSSRTLWCGLMGIMDTDEQGDSRYDVPHDAEDLSRCIDLCTFADISLEEDLPRVATIFPWYKPVLDCWEELTKLFINGEYQKVHELLSSKHDEVLRLQSYEKVGPGHWVLTKITQ